MVCGVSIYVILLLIQAYINYGATATKVVLGFTAVSLSVFFSVWAFVVFKLQADDGVWTVFGRKELLDTEDLAETAETVIKVASAAGAGSSSSSSKVAPEPEPC